MSYEQQVFRELALPNRAQVIQTILTSLLKHNGRVREFGSGDQEFADEIADAFDLSTSQRSSPLTTFVRKDKRLKNSPAWNRLLFRAADVAAKNRLISRPSETVKFTGRREWMLTEAGFEEALRSQKRNIIDKDNLPIVTVEVQKARNKLEKAKRVKDYDPIDPSKRRGSQTKESLIRSRGFRHAIVEAYSFSCCICGLRVPSPDRLIWEVEAAHIVPHKFYGKDDIWNGLALCRFHHWCFDVGWFTLRFDFTVEVSTALRTIPSDQGFMGSLDILRLGLRENERIRLPGRNAIYPHENAIAWHRGKIFTHQLRG